MKEKEITSGNMENIFYATGPRNCQQTETTLIANKIIFYLFTNALARGHVKKC